MIVTNTEVPDERNEAAIQAASTSIFDTLKEKVSSGNFSDLAAMFNQAGDGGSSVNQATSHFTDKLAGMGINLESAKRIGASLIPAIMGKLVHKTNDPNDSSFNIKDMLGKLAGGADGKFDMNDVMGMFNKSDSAQPGKNNEGGFLDGIKGMFK